MERASKTFEITTDDKRFMERAIQLSLFAQDNDHGNPFGSVVVRDGVILGEGWNKVRFANDPSAHAELEAIRDACRRIGLPRLDGSVIYASGQPCPMCLALIYLTGIERVYYCVPGKRMALVNPSLSVEHIYEAIAKPQDARPVPEIQIMSEEIDSLLGRYARR